MNMANKINIKTMNTTANKLMQIVSNKYLRIKNVYMASKNLFWIVS